MHTYGTLLYSTLLYSLSLCVEFKDRKRHNTMIVGVYSLILSLSLLLWLVTGRKEVHVNHLTYLYLFLPLTYLDRHQHGSLKVGP